MYEVDLRYQSAWNEGATQSTLNPVLQPKSSTTYFGFLRCQKITDHYLYSLPEVSGEKKTNTHIACEISGKEAINKCKAL